MGKWNLGTVTCFGNQQLEKATFPEICVIRWTEPEVTFSLQTEVPTQEILSSTLPPLFGGNFKATDGDAGDFPGGQGWLIHLNYLGI